MSGKQLEGLANSDGDEVVVFMDEFGILVQGPNDVAARTIDALTSGPKPGQRTFDRQSLTDAAAVGATGLALASTTGEYLRLTTESIEKMKKFGGQVDGSGAMRGYVTKNGKFAGQLAFEPVSLAAEQALAFQTAAVSLALRSAIADVQKAVERVEDKVDNVKDHLDSRLRGDVIGTYRHLKEVAESTNARGHLLEADWDSVAGVRNQLNRDLETMRSYVCKSADRITPDLGIPKRGSEFEKFNSDPGNVSDVLSLLLVAEQSLHLYEYLRLQRVRKSEPEFVASALKDARKSLRIQQDLDQRLVEDLSAVIERARLIEPLEIHHVWSKRTLDKQANLFDDRVRSFATETRLALPKLVV